MKNKIPIIIIMILVFALCSAIVYAKYNNKVTGNESTKVAKPVFVVSTSLNSDNSSVTNTQGVEYQLLVKNFNNNSISEVGQNYYIQFYSKDIDISNFNITLTKDGVAKTLKNYKSESFYIVGNKKETHNYVVKVTYKGTTSTNMTGKIKFKVISTQVKPS